MTTPDDTDAVNFAGLAAYWSGDIPTAREKWTRSAEADDTVAPLLLALISADAS